MSNVYIFLRKRDNWLTVTGGRGDGREAESYAPGKIWSSIYHLILSYRTLSICLGIDEPLYEHYNKNLSQLVKLASDHITQVNHIYSQVGMIDIVLCLRL